MFERYERPRRRWLWILSAVAACGGGWAWHQRAGAVPVDQAARMLPADLPDRRRRA